MNFPSYGSSGQGQKTTSRHLVRNWRENSYAGGQVPHITKFYTATEPSGTTNTLTAAPKYLWRPVHTPVLLPHISCDRGCERTFCKMKLI